MLRFSDWLKFKDCPNHAGPAVYEFRLVMNGKPVRIGRMLTEDINGTLVIGSTGGMDSRWCQSRSAHQRSSGSSTLNWLFFLERYSELLKRFPNATYEYRFAIVPSESEALIVEERLLKQYWRQYGELPPLNSNMPNRYGSYDDNEAA